MGLTNTYDWVWTYDLPRWGWVIPCILGLAIYEIGALELLERESESRYRLRLNPALMAATGVPGHACWSRLAKLASENATSRSPALTFSKASAAAIASRLTARLRFGWC